MPAGVHSSLYYKRTSRADFVTFVGHEVSLAQRTSACRPRGAGRFSRSWNAAQTVQVFTNHGTSSGPRTVQYPYLSIYIRHLSLSPSLPLSLFPRITLKAAPA